MISCSEYSKCGFLGKKHTGSECVRLGIQGELLFREDMNQMRNLTEAMTPGPPTKNGLPPEPSGDRSAPEPPAVTATDVRPYLRTLLSADTVSDPVSREAEANIKRLADVLGPYLTAATVRAYVNNLSHSDDAGKKHRKPRGFELVGELYFLHLKEEINSIENEKESLGPKIFKTYCDELFSCFLIGEHVRKGVGYSVMLMEILFDKAVTAPDQESLYFALADNSIQSAIELSKNKFEKDTLDARRATREHRKGIGPEPDAKTPHEVIDQKLLDYLVDLGSRYKSVRDGFRRTRLSENTPDSGSGARNYFASLHELLRDTDEQGYIGLIAMMQQKLGVYLLDSGEETGKEFIRSAAQNYEGLADEERDLHLVRIAAEHYRKAHESYSFVRESGRAEAVNGKLTRLKTTYDPLMLIISQL